MRHSKKDWQIHQNMRPRIDYTFNVRCFYEYKSFDIYFTMFQWVYYVWRFPVNYAQFLESFSSEISPFVSKQAVSKARQGIFYNKETFTLRSIHFLLEDGNIEYLVTNLMPEQMAAANFPDLYRLRWGVESKYRELKNRLGIEAFNCVKPVSVRQEFFAAMYLSNLAAIIKSQADSKIAASDDNRHDYQSNRSYILNRVKSCI